MTIELLILLASLAFCVAGIALHTIGVSPALRRGAACLWAAAEVGRLHWRRWSANDLQNLHLPRGQMRALFWEGETWLRT